MTDDYPQNWPDIARSIKEAAGWKCEQCHHANDYESGHVLTVHHLNGIKADCRTENLVALCQRCHLRIQAKYQPGQMWLLGKPAWAVKRNL
jgi:hypothetical protein